MSRITLSLKKLGLDRKESNYDDATDTHRRPTDRDTRRRSQWIGGAQTSVGLGTLLFASTNTGSDTKSHQRGESGSYLMDDAASPSSVSSNDDEPERELHELEDFVPPRVDIEAPQVPQLAHVNLERDYPDLGDMTHAARRWGS
jgi:hypothetical protein